MVRNRSPRASALIAASLLVLSIGVSAVPASAALPPPETGIGKAWGPTYGASGVHAEFGFRNVWACSSTATKGPTPFDENGTQSFQCVELSARYLWALYGLWVPHPSDGWNLVANVHASYPKKTTVGTPSPTSVPVAGDVISLGPGGAVDGSVGHTAVIIAANPSTGVFTTLSQNFPEGTAGKQNWKVDLTGAHNGRVQYRGPNGIGAWTKASWLVLPQTPSTALSDTTGAHPADPVCTNNGIAQGTHALTLTGKYYFGDAGQPLVIKSNNWLLDNPRVVVSGGGRWTFTFEIPRRAYGTYPITVADGNGVIWTMRFLSGAYTCYVFNGSDWTWDAVGWDAYSPMTFSIDGEQQDTGTAFQNGYMSDHSFTWACTGTGRHDWTVTGTLDTAPGYATGPFGCSTSGSAQGVPGLR